MSSKNSVIWSQGLFLRPEHFQQQQRFQDYQIGSLSRSAFSYGWGLTHLTISTAELTNAQFAVEHIRGLMPDGLAFDTSVESNLPASFDLKSHTRDLTIYLAITRSRSDSVEVSANPVSGQHRRYTLSPVSIVDTSHTGGELESIGPNDTIETAIPNLKLVSSEENLEDLDCIPIARIKDVDSNGVAVLDKSFVPTCLSISCSSYLTHMNKNLLSTLSILRNKINDLLGDLITPNTGEDTPSINPSIFSHGVFPLLQVINRHTSLLNHTIVKHNCHPEELYRILLAFYGEVSSFVEPYVPQTSHLFDYDHLNISGSLGPLATGLDQKLTTIIDSIESFTDYSRPHIAQPELPIVETEQQIVEDKSAPSEEELGGIVVDVGSKNRK